MITTQLSLIARLKDPQDDDAWRRFVSLYHPAIVRSLQRKGLQHADAEDTAQQVLVSIAKTLAKRPHDPDRARFRTWLERVIRNAAINVLRRARPDAPRGGDDDFDVLNTVPSSDDGGQDGEVLAAEFQRQIFHVAADEVKVEFEEKTWHAFWRTSIDGEAIDDVAKDLGMQRGSVYAARSRVMRRFRVEVERLQKKYSSMD